MIHSPGLIIRTVRHLTPRQVLYQVLHRLRGRAYLRRPSTAPVGYFIDVPEPDKPVSRVNGAFTFLNQQVWFPDNINWNYADFGKLWTYHLNYFDYLNQSNLEPQAGWKLIRDFIAQSDRINAGLESYPTSLRILNWVQFLSRYQLQDQVIDAHLYAQISLLRRRIEYHLAGNHLLENGFALLMGSLYFRHRPTFRAAGKLVRAELTKQVLTDGGHDERSPMYHQILLNRLLDVLLALQTDTWHTDPTLVAFLTGRATQMLAWLEAVTFANGDVPMVNDAAWGMAPTTAQIRAKAERVGLLARRMKLPTSSGYRMFRRKRYELFANVGPPGPDHQPGHAHADTFSFVLYVDNRPLIVDSGTSTYQPGARRMWERSTAAHNTVEVAGQNSSEVWSSFRVGRRARVMVSVDTETTLTARHDGYRRLGIVHERSWVTAPAHLRIVDQLTGRNHGLSGMARFHVQADVPVVLTGTGAMVGPARLTFASEEPPTLQLRTYELADGFNRLRPAPCIEVTFTNRLTTTITPAV